MILARLVLVTVLVMVAAWLVGGLLRRWRGR
jgi:hypothetical protein